MIRSGVMRRTLNIINNPKQFSTQDWQTWFNKEYTSSFDELSTQYSVLGQMNHA